MKTGITITVLLAVAQVSTLCAHALWIETNGGGTRGKAHSINIFYGEYATREFEPVDKWYSDVNTFTLWLVSPDGEKKQLTYHPAGNHFTASFTPEQEGTYFIITGHSAKDVDGTTVYQFNSSATVNVGRSETPGKSPIGTNELFLEPVKSVNGKKGIVKAYYKGQPASKIAITVSGPTGWSKGFETDEQGVVQFETLWKGWYALEGFYTSAEKGNHFDAPYEQIWRCATTRVSFEQ